MTGVAVRDTNPRQPWEIPLARALTLRKHPPASCFPTGMQMLGLFKLFRRPFELRRQLVELHQRRSALAGKKHATLLRCPWWADFPAYSHAWMQARGMLGPHVPIQRPPKRKHKSL